MGAKNMTREARDMELLWFDIRELTEDAAQTVIGMMDETRRRRPWTSRRLPPSATVYGPCPC